MAKLCRDNEEESDTINAVKESLIVKLERHDSFEDRQAKGLDRPFYTCHYDFSLKAAVPVL